MLKSCWDCLVGNQVQGDEVYATELNGLTQAPPWPQPQLRNESMFILPKPIEFRDTIIIDGDMQDNPRLLKVGLITGSSSPDYDNTACQLEVNYPPNNDGKIDFKIIKDGEQQIVNGDDLVSTETYFPGSTFKIKFYIKDPFLSIFAGDSYVHQIKLMHNVEDIRFLSVSGDVNKVSGIEFKFG